MKELYCITSQRYKYILYSLLYYISEIHIVLFTPANSSSSINTAAQSIEGFICDILMAGHIVGQQQLTSYLQKALSDGPRNVVLFLQDKMSIEDFTMYGGAFGNKQDTAFPNLEGALMSSSSPLVLPAVSWPASNAVIGQLQDHLDTSPLYMDPETLSQLRLNASSPALLVFRLPYERSGSWSTHVLSCVSDEVIGQVMSTMKTQAVPYTAIYTALRPARVSWFSSGPRSLRGGGEEEERGGEERRGEERRGEGGGRGRRINLFLVLCRLVLNYENVLGHRSFKLIFAMSQRHYKVSARRWFTLDSVQLEYDSIKAKFNASRSVYAPAEFSYRCQSVSSFRWPQLVPHAVNDPANQWRVSFEDFQIQGFNVTGGDFSYASDCAGFFSPGIWMGLMTSLLMVLVLTYGLHMIMQLRTMDRFDDPKGPAISVPQTE
uniref:ATPase H+ transporting accessory protein 1a n=1 Tax=Cyclopterus lumpus TaxID=8103 RepID=A0A8C2XGZ0_CYCLU